LVGVICQGIVYGVFLVLFGATVYVLSQKNKQTQTNKAFLGTAIVMFVLITINFSVSWSRLMQGIFIEEDATAYLGDLTQWKEVFRTGVYVGLTAVADSLFIYRLYMVWGRNIWVCLVPILLLCGSLTSGIGIEVAIGTLKGAPLFASGIAAWATSFFSISLSQNLITTCLIVYRIWRVNIGVAGINSHSLWPVMAIILESGALYSATLLCLLATYATGSFAQYICLDILVPLIGCTFCLIIVRVGLGLTKSTSAHPDQSQDHGRVTIGGTHIGSRGYPMRKININVARTIDVDEGDIDVERGMKDESDTDAGDVYDNKVRFDNRSYEQNDGSKAF